MIRTTALVIAILLASSTAGAEWLLCAGSPRATAARHACCKDMQMVVTADQAAGCCTLSGQTRDRAPVEVVYQPLVTLPLLATPRPVVLVRPQRHSVRSSVLHPPSVPLYLRERTLLI
jgi:hypothetical protein